MENKLTSSIRSTAEHQDIFQLRDLIKEIEVEQAKNKSIDIRDVLSIARNLVFSATDDCGCGDCDNENLCPVCGSKDFKGYAKEYTHTVNCKLNDLIKSISKSTFSNYLTK